MVKYMTDEEAAAEEYADFEWGASPIDKETFPEERADAIKAFLAGVEHGRKQIEQRERMAWEAARAPRKIEPVFGVPGFLPVGQRYATFDDWKKEQGK